MNTIKIRCRKWRDIYHFEISTCCDMKPALVIVPLFLCIATAQDDEEEAPPVVQTEQGAVRGIKGVSIRGQDFYAFLGVPYAKPPLGYLRFKVIKN